MNLPTVVFVSLTNGDEILCVNGALIMQSEADYSVHGVHETATTLAKALGVKLVEYNNTPVPDYDEWTIDDVLSALPELPFTCGECYQRCKTDPPQRLKIDPGVNLLL